MTAHPPGSHDADRSDTMPLMSGTDVVLVRQRLRQLAVAMGLTLVQQTKLVTTTSELARNCVGHGGGGLARCAVIDETIYPYRRGIRLTVSDKGPGIPDVELAMTEGWTSTNGLGLGLPGSRRLADDFALHTVAGEGTTVTVTFWRAP